MKMIRKTGRVVAISAVAIILALIIILTLTAGSAQTTAGSTEPTTDPVKLEIKQINQTEVELIAKTIWGEARGVKSDAEKAAVAWCVLNRVDADEFPDTITEVITEPMQFIGYCEENPVEPKLAAIARDVLRRWEIEKREGYIKGRTLPAEYTFMWGDGEHNHFTKEWLGDEEWDWSLPSPYSID